MPEHETPVNKFPYPDVKGKVKIEPADLQELAERLETVLLATAPQLHEIGDIKGSMLLTPPTGWLICEGQEVSQTTYAALYAVIKGKYGAAEAGKFKLPSALTRFPIGYSGTHALGTYGGEEVVFLTGVQSGLPEHNHPTAGMITEPKVGNRGTSLDTVAYRGASTALPEATNWLTNVEAVPSTTATSSHTNTPPYFNVNFFIKYQ